MEQISKFHQDHDGERKFVITLLTDVIENIEKCHHVIEKIQCVATARFCLQCTAKYLQECYSGTADSNSNLHGEVFNLASRLCNLPIKFIR